jgi:hypothetical protein
MKRVLIIFLALGAIAAAQNRPEWMSCDMHNGRFWNDLKTINAEEVVKGTYLIGVLDTWQLKAQAGEQSLWPDGAHVEEVRKALDKFYLEPANIQIPITIAIFLTSSNFRGDPNMEQKVRSMRQFVVAEGCNSKPEQAKEQ